MRNALTIPAVATLMSILITFSAAADDANSANALTAMGETELTLSEIKNLDEVGSVQIVSIETVGSTEGEKLQSELNNRQADLKDLQSAMGANEALMNNIREQDPDFSLGSVVALDKKENGQLVIYTLGQGASN
jgi:hypothetical protein